MKTKLFLFATFISQIIFSQCPPADVTLTSQAQINTFIADYPNCTQIDGNLTLSGITINDLTPLNNITTINGGLTISTTAITNGNIFNNLTNIAGILNIQANPNLVNLSGFNGLVTTPSTIQFNSNASLTQITGFNALTTVGQNLSFVGGATSPIPITDISGFSNIQSVGYLLIRQTGLTNLNQLSGLQAINLGLSIDQNPNLTSIAGLSNCTNALNGNGTLPFRIFDNHVLQSLDGINFSSVTNSVDVQIYNLFLVQNINPLSCLQGSFPNVVVRGMPLLQNLNGLSNITSIGAFNIQNLPLVTALPNWNLTQLGSMSVSNMANINSIASLSGLTSIGNSNLFNVLSLLNLPQLTNLNGLQNIVNLNNKSITISTNSSLTDISALNNLDINTLGGFLISGNNSLSTCNVAWVCDRLALNLNEINISNNASGCESIGVVQDACNPEPCPPGNVILLNQNDVNDFVALYPNCTIINGNLQIGANGNSPLISDLSGLSNLTTINGTFRVINNGVLTSLNGLQNLNLITDWIHISENNSLNDISQLAGLTSINSTNSNSGGLSITSCFSLTNLNGLQNITNLNGKMVSLFSNASLINIEGIANINATTIGALEIVFNTSLSNCEITSVCQKLELDEANVSINNNGSNCATKPLVQAACEALTSESFNISNMAVYPIPFEDTLLLNFNQPIEGQVKIVDIMGKILYQSKINDNHLTINNLSYLSNGIYVLQIENLNGDILNQKIVK